MDSLNLPKLCNEQIALARASTSGRAAHTIHGGHEHALRQTVIALAAGNGLDEHESPGEATLHVLAGRVRLDAGEDLWIGVQGDFLVIPPARHSVHAVVDAAILLTVSVKTSRG